MNATVRAVVVIAAMGATTATAIAVDSLVAVTIVAVSSFLLGALAITHKDRQ